MAVSAPIRISTVVIIDRRAGSAPLAEHADLKGNCQLGDLEFGDVLLTGHGPDDGQIRVGVEVKSITDLLQSIESKRLPNHQMPGLLDKKNYDYAWLAVYGWVRPSTENYLEYLKYGKWKLHYIRRGQPTPYSYLEGWLLTAQMLTPIKVKWFYSPEEICTWIAVYDRWLSKPWDKHKGLQGFNQSGEQASPFGADPVEAQMARIAAQFPGVGWTRAWAAAKHFGSVEEMLTAKASEWEKIPRMGPVLSKVVRDTIRRTK